MASQARKPLRIEVPKDENPRLGRVGLIAVVGFALGIAWPRVAGMRLVPAAPTEKTETNAADLSGAPVDGGVPALPPSASASPPETETESQNAQVVPAPAPPAGKELFSVGPGEVTSCRDHGGKRRENCDTIDFDALARARIATLNACDAAARADGVLSLGFELDFEKDRVTGLQSGKRTSLAEADANALLGCLRKTLGSIALSGLKHEHDRYTVYYRVDFKGPDEQPATPTASGAGETVPASGKATVAWDVALVRAQPLRDAKVVARVLQGTRVSVTGRNGDWYRVKYDAKGNEGWAFRTAIGM